MHLAGIVSKETYIALSLPPLFSLGFC